MRVMLAQPSYHRGHVAGRPGRGPVPGTAASARGDRQRRRANTPAQRSRATPQGGRFLAFGTVFDHSPTSHVTGTFKAVEYPDLAREGPYT
jgi:hypothetical protein